MTKALINITLGLMPITHQRLQKNMMRKSVSLLLAFVMVLSMVPAALAVDVTENDDAIKTFAEDRGTAVSRAPFHRALNESATGQHMSHFIIRDGRFDIACAKLLKKGYKIHWQQQKIEPVKNKKNKVK